MKKRILSFLMAFILIITSSPLEIFATNAIKVLLDGKEIIFDQEPLLIDGRVRVPIRQVAESMGWEVIYNEDLSFNDISIKKQASDNHLYGAFINLEDNYLDPNTLRIFASIEDLEVIGEIAPLDPLPIIVNNRTLIGLRQLGEALHAKVEWIGETRTVKISSQELPFINKTKAEALKDREIDKEPIVEPPVDLPITEDKPEKTLEELINTSFVLEEEMTEELVKYYESEMIRLINEERVKNGLHELKVHDELMNVARYRAEESKDYEVNSHMSPTIGKEHTELVRHFGIDCTYAGENFTSAHDNDFKPQSAFNAWMGSPSHKKGILYENVEYLGVGYAYGYWIMIIMRT